MSIFSPNEAALAANIVRADLGVAQALPINRALEAAARLHDQELIDAMREQAAQAEGITEPVSPMVQAAADIMVAQQVAEA
ncbi:MAG TPA: hypothetical protein VHT70_03435 [Candidatus Saccharimonadales bacterium]|jgi:hypothetical protein|nr:hypothetical protein [Candidatus Saccharimonadales bacterium]